MHFRSRRMPAPAIAAVALTMAASALLTGCSSTGELVVEEGVGITAVRSACPAVGIADYTGDITLFRAPGSTDSRNIAMTAAMTDLRSQCDPKGSPVNANVSFQVLARRVDGRGVRDVTLPYFVSVVRGGTAVISKRIGQVTLHFAEGQTRTEATALGVATIDKAEATLNSEVRDRITKKRKAGEADAAIDPLADPEVKAAVARATFDVLVGFQLSPEQLAYNASR